MHIELSVAALEQVQDDQHILVLDVLNRARKEKGEYACVNLQDIANDLKIDFDFFMMRYGNELHKLGYIVPDIGHNAYITSKGIAILKQNNPTVNITLDFLSKLEEQIEKSALPVEDKRLWLIRIREMASHPLLASPISAALSAVVQAYQKP